MSECAHGYSMFLESGGMDEDATYSICCGAREKEEQMFMDNFMDLCLNGVFGGMGSCEWKTG